MNNNRGSDPTDELRKLPQVDRLARSIEGPSHAVKVAAARAAVEEAAQAIRNGNPAPSDAAITERAVLHLRSMSRRRLKNVINATGVLLHTNLGRAPIAPQALDAVTALASGYTNLEYSIDQGQRGSRYERASESIITLTGAEAAIVVNNNAAAVVLVLSALAKGWEVIVSRGELIEIGGEFRLPNIMAESGALLKEVGTTNRTHLKDYSAAISESTKAIMKVHPSNFEVTGFTAVVSSSSLAGLAKSNSLSFIHDLGSGLLRNEISGSRPSWLSNEPTVQEAVRESADAITFSGDKLMGGPQCGIILCTREVQSAMLKSALLRAFRVDKMTLAALEATLFLYLEGRESELPLWTMALIDTATIESRAQAIIDRVGPTSYKVTLTDGFSTTGGGSAPSSAIPTVLIEISTVESTTNQIFRALLDSEPPLIARTQDERIVIDLRTVDPSLDNDVSRILTEVLSG